VTCFLCDRLTIFNWQKQLQLASCCVGCDKILALAHNTLNNEILCCGVDHLSFWSLQARNKLHGIQGDFGILATVQTIICADFVKQGENVFTLTGSVSGCIFVWKGVQAIQVIKAHSGSIIDLVVLQSSDDCMGLRWLLTGCKDGMIRLWEIVGMIGQGLDLKEREALAITSFSNQKQASIRNLSGTVSNILIGTSLGDVFETKISCRTLHEPRALIRSHQEGKVPAVVSHPLHDRIAFSIGSDKTLRAWDIVSKQARNVVTLCEPACALDVSLDGRLIAVGLTNGMIQLWKVNAATLIHNEELTSVCSRYSKSGIVSVLRFFKDSRTGYDQEFLLAAGTEEGDINIYSSLDNLRHLGTCRGHTGKILAIDADIYGRILQSNSSAFELLFWSIEGKDDAKINCQSIRSSEASTAIWTDWTCIFGWPVQNAFGKTNTSGESTVFSPEDEVMYLHSQQHLGLCVAADCRGAIGLFPFPFLPETRCKVLDRVRTRSPVSCVRLFDHEIVVSSDCIYGSLMLWRLAADLGVDTPQEILPAQTEPNNCLRSVSGRFLRSAGLLCAVTTEGLGNPSTKEGKIIGVADVRRHSMKAPKAWSFSAEQSFPPENEMVPEYIHGYRGIDDNSNIYLIENELLYYTAGFCILANFQNERRTQRIFEGHCRENQAYKVTSIAVHPDKIRIASGDAGPRPSILVWNAKTLDIEARIRGLHRHSVAALCFNSNGTLLASVAGDQDSSLYLHEWKTKTLIYESPAEANRTILILKCNPFNGTLVSCGVNHISFWKIQGHGRNVHRYFGVVDPPQTILCADFLESKPDESLTVTAGELGAIYLWKDRAAIVPGSNIRPISCIFAHPGPIYDVACDSTSILSCGEGGWVKLWNLSTGEREYALKCQIGHKLMREREKLLSPCPFCPDNICIRSILWLPTSPQGAKMILGLSCNAICEADLHGTDLKVLVQGHGQSRMSCLAMHPCSGLFASCSEDKVVTLWSKEERRALKIRDVESEPYVVEFTPDGGFLLVGLSGGQVLMFSAKLLDSVSSPFPEIFSTKAISVIRFSPHGNLLAITDMSGNIFVFLAVWSGSSCTYKHKAKCNIHVGGILRLDWSTDCKFVQVETDRHEMIVWEIDADSTSQYLRTEDHSEIPWATKTCVLGWHTQGYLHHAGSLFRLCGDRSNRMDVLASGDEDGKIALFRNPCPEKNASAKIYHGHVGPISAVRFTFDDKNIISVGLTDNSIVVWQHLIIPQNEYDSEVEFMVNSAKRSDIKPVEHEGDEFKASKPFLSSLIAPSIQISQPMDAPTQSLRLDHVFGSHQKYRKVDFLNTEEILYLAGAVAVLVNPSSGRQRFYREHTESISTMCCQSTNEIVLTAQTSEEFCIHVWSVRTLKSISKFSGPCKIINACFTADGDKIVVLGWNGKLNTIMLFDWNAKTKLASEDFGPQAILDVGCHPEGAMIVTCGSDDANGHGCVTFWSLKRGSWHKKHGFFGDVARSSTMLCIDFSEDTSKFTLTGSQNGCIYLWKTQILFKVIVGHRGPVFDLCVHHNNVVSCGKHGIVKIWDAEWTDSIRLDVGELTSGIKSAGSGESQTIHSVAIHEFGGDEKPQFRLVLSLRNNEIFEFTLPRPLRGKTSIQQVRLISQGHSFSGIRCLCAHPQEQYFATSGFDKTLQIWDCVVRRAIGVVRLPEIAHAIVYTPDGRKIIAGLSSGRLLSIDPANPLVYEVLSGKSNGRSITCLKYSPSGKYLAIGCGHGAIYIADVQKQNSRISKCRGLTESAIIHIDWSESEAVIQANTSNYELFFWDIQTGQRIVRSSQVRDEIWATWTCTMGWYVHGIKNSASQVKCAIKAKGLNLIAVGDIYGKITLYRFPLCSSDAVGRSFHGHSQVLDACFTCNDKHLITIGGTDMIAIQWAVEQLDEEDIRKSEIKAEISGPICICEFAALLRGTERDQWISEANSENALIQAVMNVANLDESGLFIARVLKADDVLIRFRIQASSVDRRFALLLSDLRKPGSRLRSLKVDDLILHEDVYHMENRFEAASRQPIVHGLSADFRDIYPEGNVLPYVAALIAPSSPTGLYSKEVPHHELDVEFVHGYRGRDLAGGIFSLESGGILYVMGKLAVIHDAGSNKQFYFRKHDYDISCIALHPAGLLVATCDNTKTPTLIVWSAETTEVLSLLNLETAGPVRSLTFFKQNQLFCVCGHQEKTFNLYDWKLQCLICSTKGDSASIFGVRWNHLDDDGSTLSFGVNHLKFWNLTKSALARSASVRLDAQGSNLKARTYLCAAFPSNVITIVGTDDGSILFLRRRALIKSIDAVHSGAIFDIWASGSQIFTGGEDGYVHRWRLDLESIEVVLVYLKSNDLTRVDEAHSNDPTTENLVWSRPSITAIAYHHSWSTHKAIPTLLVGTASNAIYEIDEQSDNVRCLVRGHGDGRVSGLSTHPQDANLFVTCGEDGLIHLWSCDQHQRLKSRQSKEQLSCVQFSDDGKHLAVGSLRGTLHILDAATLKDVIAVQTVTKNSQVMDLKYSPQNRFLAVALYCRIIQLHDVDDRYSLSTTLRGHLFPLKNLDWDQSGRFLRSTSNGNELMYWDCRSHARVGELEQIRDSKWHTNHCTIGWHLKGLLPDSIDDIDSADDSKIRHIMAVDVCAKGLLALCALDGSVMIFRTPCEVSGQGCKAYSVHSQLIESLRFTCDCKRLISIGGGDGAVVQWSIVDEMQDPDLRSILVMRTPNEMSQLSSSRKSVNSTECKAITGHNPLPLNSFPAAKGGLLITERDIKHAPALQYDALETENVLQDPVHQDHSRCTLKLRHIYGHDGQEARNCLWTTSRGQVLYSAGSVCVRSELHHHTEMDFFTEHKNPVNCMALHADDRHVATGEAGPEPVVYVWECGCMQVLHRLDGSDLQEAEKFQSGITALSFVDEKLIIASGGADHSLHLYNWRSARRLACINKLSGRIFGCRGFVSALATPFEWVTAGSDNIRYWRLKGVSLESRPCVWGRPGIPCSLLVLGGLLAIDTVALYHSGSNALRVVTLAAGADGRIYVIGKAEDRGSDVLGSSRAAGSRGEAGGDSYEWRMDLLAFSVEAHHGAVMDLRCSKLDMLKRESAALVLTGGKDGHVCIWNLVGRLDVNDKSHWCVSLEPFDRIDMSALSCTPSSPDIDGSRPYSMYDKVAATNKVSNPLDLVAALCIKQFARNSSKANDAHWTILVATARGDIWELVLNISSDRSQVSTSYRIFTSGGGGGKGDDKYMTRPEGKQRVCAHPSKQVVC
jgi:WD40 repeat protein